MGAVYRAEQVTLQREVAVKVLPRGLSKNADFVARFKREAETVAKLDQHPNIISILDYDTTDDAVSYVVMPLLEGGTLSERLQNGPPFDLPQVADMLRKIAGALQFAHNHGIVHRDIKPDNIMFDKFGTPMVTDFGIAKIVSVDVTTLTGQGMTVGTPLYMAPEQWKSEAIGPYTDQYALAVVVYMLVTGKAPFSSSTPQGMMYKHLEQPPQSVLEISDRLPAALDVVLMQALHKQPNGRFPHVVAFAEAFERAVKSPESFYQTRSTPLPPTNADLLQTRTPHTPLPNYPGYSPTPLPRNATPLPTAATPLPLGTPSQPEIQVATQRSWLLVAAAALLLLLLAGAAVVVTGGGGDNGGNGNDSGAAVADDIVGEDETQTTVALNALAGTDDPTATTTATATERSAAEPTEVVEDIAASPTPNPSQAPSDTPTPEPSITATPPLTDTPAPTGEPSATPTDMPTATATNTATQTPSSTATATTTDAPTATNTLTLTPSVTVTPLEIAVDSTPVVRESRRFEQTLLAGTTSSLVTVNDLPAGTVAFDFTVDDPDIVLVEDGNDGTDLLTISSLATGETTVQVDFSLENGQIVSYVYTVFVAETENEPPAFVRDPMWFFVIRADETQVLEINATDPDGDPVTVRAESTNPRSLNITQDIEGDLVIEGRNPGSGTIFITLADGRGGETTFETGVFISAAEEQQEDVPFFSGLTELTLAIDEPYTLFFDPVSAQLSVDDLADIDVVIEDPDLLAISGPVYRPNDPINSFQIDIQPQSIGQTTLGIVVTTTFGTEFSAFERVTIVPADERNTPPTVTGLNFGETLEVEQGSTQSFALFVTDPDGNLDNEVVPPGISVFRCNSQKLWTDIEWPRSRRLEDDTVVYDTLDAAENIFVFTARLQGLQVGETCSTLRVQDSNGRIQFLPLTIDVVPPANSPMLDFPNFPAQFISQDEETLLSVVASYEDDPDAQFVYEIDLNDNASLEVEQVSPHDYIIRGREVEFSGPFVTIRATDAATGQSTSVDLEIAVSSAEMQGDTTIDREQAVVNNPNFESNATTELNSPPQVTTPIADSYDVSFLETLRLPIEFSDPDGDEVSPRITVSGRSLDWRTLPIEGGISLNMQPIELESSTVTVILRDDNGGETTFSFVVNVLDDSPRPVAAQTVTSANVRGGPGTEFDIIGRILGRQDITLLARERADDTVWYYIEFEDTEVWLPRYLVDIDDSSALNVPTIAEFEELFDRSVEIVDVPEAFATVTGDTVNVRSGPGLGFDVIGVAEANERYPVLAQSEGDAVWYQIQLNEDVSGWIAGFLVQIDPPDAEIPGVSE